ncbi:MAG: RNA polymerase sigma factor [Planctomycetota bacterium]|jgi:RNA polymerase sigma-70 factor (ECF subfamily)
MAAGNKVDELPMAVYLSHMAFSTLPAWTLRAEAQRLLVQLAHAVGESFSQLEKSKETCVPHTDDIEDIRKSRHGDSDAFRRLIERHQAHVGRIMWRFSRDQRVHEELVQDVFVEAYLSLRTYRGKSPFAHWLSRIATRVGYHYWKQASRQRTTESFSLQDWDQLTSSATEKGNPSQAAALLHELMAKLPPRDRLVLTLRYLEECDVAETARRTGWTRSMVKVQTWRARKKLQQLFAEMERR